MPARNATPPAGHRLHIDASHEPMGLSRQCPRSDHPLCCKHGRENAGGSSAPPLNMSSFVLKHLHFISGAAWAFVSPSILSSRYCHGTIGERHIQAWRQLSLRVAYRSHRCSTPSQDKSHVCSIPHGIPRRTQTFMAAFFVYT